MELHVVIKEKALQGVLNERLRPVALVINAGR